MPLKPPKVKWRVPPLEVSRRCLPLEAPEADWALRLLEVWVSAAGSRELPAGARWSPAS